MEYNLDLLKKFLSQAYQSSFNRAQDHFTTLSWDNPVVSVVIISLLLILMEQFLPRKKDYAPLERKGFKMDIFYVLFYDVILYGSGIYFLLGVVEFLLVFFIAWMGEDSYLMVLVGQASPKIDVSTWPIGFQFLFVFIMGDFLTWFGHYLMHRVNFFWQFHKIHHAQEDLGFASSRHFHWGEYVSQAVFFVPFFLIGTPVEVYFIVEMWTANFFGFFSHANIKFKWGFLNYVFITPDTHYWHHAMNIPKPYGVNYASILPIWDIVFGSYYNDDSQEPILGIPNNDVPKGFIGQSLYPFLAWFGIKSGSRHQSTNKK